MPMIINNTLMFFGVKHYYSPLHRMVLSEFSTFALKTEILFEQRLPIVERTFMKIILSNGACAGIPAEDRVIVTRRMHCFGLLITIHCLKVPFVGVKISPRYS